MKYDIVMSCGHTDTVELFGKTSERERRINSMMKDGLCRECYAKRMREREEEQGLVFNAAVMPDIDEHDGSILLNVWFSGNTKPCKDAIRRLGYYWSERASAASYFSGSRPPMIWRKTIKLSELQGEMEKAASIGANSLVTDSGLFASACYGIALNKHREWCDRQQKLTELVKPDVPDIISEHRWNGTIYGKSGNYSIYLDGAKVSVTDDQAEELRQYIQEKETYNKQVQDIMIGK